MSDAVAAAKAVKNGLYIGSEFVANARKVANAYLAWADTDDLLREALRVLANAADDVGVKFFDTDDMPPEVERMQRATQAARILLAEQSN